MKKSILLTLLLSIVLATSAAVKQTKLRVLYVGGNSNFDIVSNIVDSLTNAQSVKERMASFEAFLKEYFTQVTVVNAKDYNYRMSYDYDVTVIDGEPQPLKPKEMIYEGQMVKKIVYAQYFPDDFDQPVLTIAELGETLGRRMGVKNDWYCLCLDQWAHSMRTSHPIFKGPYKVNITLEERPTPDGAKEYAPLLGQTLPETTPMWRVNTKGYMTDRGFKIGMVSRPWGYEDSPEAEWIAGGNSSKSIDAMSLGRHANFFHWGFAAAPMDMTEEAKPLLANAIVYISKFKGQHVIARKLNENISTRIEARENAYRVTADCYNSYAESIRQFNEASKHVSDSVKAAKAAGKKLGKMEEFYLQWQPQPISTREEFLREMAGELFDKFGTDEKAYADYYAENTPYFYGLHDGYGLKLDEDAKSLQIANNDLRLIKKAIELWQTGEDTAKGKRILQRYTLLRYETPEQYAAWLKKNEKKLFFTESGGWLWLVDSQDANVEGNDYSILDKQEERKKPEISEKTDRMNPVIVSALVDDLADGSKELVVRIKIHPGFHIYGFVAEQDPYIASTFDIELPAGWEKDGDMELPTFRTDGDYGTTIYEGDVLFRQRIKGSGHGKLKLTVGYQTCDEHACLPPRSVEFAFDL